MKIISHRCNSVAQLRNTPTQYGVEVDIRSQGANLVMHHDPFEKGELFEPWIAIYDHAMLILNVKEEGLEYPLLQLMQSYRIDNYFFLDQSFPFLMKFAKLGNKNSAIRVSEFESIETAVTLAGKVNWVWVDCFNHFPLYYQDAQRLQNLGFNICIVSPELQGRNPLVEIPQLIKTLKYEGISPEAVCCKNIDLWETGW